MGSRAQEVKTFRVEARPHSGKQDKRDEERQVARRVPVVEGGVEQVQ